MANLLSVADPWSPTVLKAHYDDLDWASIKPKVDALIARVKNNTGLEQGGGISTVDLQDHHEDQPHTWQEFDQLRHWIMPRVDEAIDRWRLTRQRYQVTNSWINRHDNGAWTEEHTHPGIQITLAFYLSVPENSGRILFRDPMAYHWAGQPSEQRKITGSEWYPVEVTTGDLCIFPGWIPHKTEVNQSKESRYVLTINLWGQVPFKYLATK